jgi:hypothetical protein
MKPNVRSSRPLFEVEGMSESKIRTTESAMGSSEDASASSAQNLLVCRKTGRTMTWDEAFCPNEGETCGYRGECQILVVLAEKRDDGDQTDESRP